MPGDSERWRYVVLALMLAIVVTVWLRERDHAGQHFAPALAVGAITLFIAFTNLLYSLHANVLEK